MKRNKADKIIAEDEAMQKLDKIMLVAVQDAVDDTRYEDKTDIYVLAYSEALKSLAQIYQRYAERSIRREADHEGIQEDMNSVKRDVQRFVDEYVEIEHEEVGER